MKIPKRFITLVLGVPAAALGVVACYGHIHTEDISFEIDLGQVIVEGAGFSFTDEDLASLGDEDPRSLLGGPILITQGIRDRGTGKHLFPTRLRCITSGFGERTDPIDGTDGWHSGIDVCAGGKNSRAVADGVVTFAGYNAGYGNMVEIAQEDGYKTLYAHHARLFVQTGDEVKAGEELGEIGSTGRSTGPHLHFEVRKKNKKGEYILINPRTYIY